MKHCFALMAALIAAISFISPVAAFERRCTAQALQPQDLSTRVVGISDGDTLHAVFPRGHWAAGNQRVRLIEIDAPESSQPFGKRAKQALSALVFGQQVTLRVVGRDIYCRPLAAVYREGSYVNLLMVQQGYAWANKEFGRDPAFAKAQAAAQRARAGLWADPNPIYPGSFRRKGSAS